MSIALTISPRLARSWLTIKQIIERKRLMRKVITGALIALAVAVILLAVTGLVWYVPATDTVKGHYCLGTIAQCFKN